MRERVSPRIQEASFMTASLRILAGSVIRHANIQRHAAFGKFATPMRAMLRVSDYLQPNRAYRLCRLCPCKESPSRSTKDNSLSNR